MFLEIKNLLNPAEVSRLIELAGKLKFVDGRISNPANTSKNNLQADHSDPDYAESSRIVTNAFARSREFRDFAFPKRIAPPLLSRYEVGMRYGAHADTAQMNLPSGSLRADLSSTVFLSDPTSYEGGELSMHMGSRLMSWKGGSGDAVIYPSTMIHQVEPVRAGTRLVSITFIESRIADAARREVLSELNEVIALEGANMRWENRVRLECVSQNLYRSWSQTD